jgi:hypothetical protein
LVSIIQRGFEEILKISSIQPKENEMIAGTSIKSFHSSNFPGIFEEMGTKA